MPACSRVRERAVEAIELPAEIAGFVAAVEMRVDAFDLEARQAVSRLDEGPCPLGRNADPLQPDIQLEEAFHADPVLLRGPRRLDVSDGAGQVVVGHNRSHLQLRQDTAVE